jgi:glycosyltransferase involved in cell wall biosynthesis
MNAFSRNPPRITIITPTLNSVAHVEQCIRSVLDQGYPDLEYWVIDGGSTDGTLDVIRRHESHLAGWTSEKDSGISDAFNKGVSHATGEVIGIINSDDWYEPGALAAVAEAYCGMPEPAILHGDVMWESPTGAVRVRPRRWPGAVYFDMPVLHPTCFIPRSAYDEVGGYGREYRLAMDYDLILRAHRRGISMRYLPRVLAHFRMGGASTKRTRECLREVYRSQRSQGVPSIVAGVVFAGKMAVNSLKSFVR